MKPSYLGLVRSPHVQRFDRVANGHVPVHAHHRQGEGAGEHVVVVDGHHRLAQGVSEWPEAQEHICALETSRNDRMNIETQLEAEQRTPSPLESDFEQLISQRSGNKSAQ